VITVVTPQDDPAWPICHDGSPLPDGCKEYHKTRWCEHVRWEMLNADDKMDFGMRHVVPVFPHLGFYAEVSVDTERIADVMATLALVITTDPFSQDEEFESLGLWTKGEGRLIVAGAINNWTEAQEAEQCTYAGHSYNQEMKLNYWRNVDPNVQQPSGMDYASFWKANKWCIAYHKMCYPCYELENASSVSDPTFGLADVTAPRSNTPNQQARGNRNRAAGGNQINTTGTPAPGRPSSTRDLLRSRQGRTQRTMTGYDPANGKPLYVNPNTGRLEY
jgi:hypothetical protein